MIAKNHDGPLFFKLFYRMFLDGIAGAKFLFSGEYKNFFAVLKAHRYFRKDLFKKTLKKRKAIKEQSTEFNAKGFYSGSILWAFFFKKVKTFKQLNQRLFK